MRIRDIVLQVAGRIAQYATVSTATAKGFDSITLPVASEDEPTNQSQARRLQDFGFRSVPVAGSECAVLGIRGSTSNKIIVATDNLRHGPLDLKSGEVAVYNKVAGTVIKLDVDGNVTIIPGANAQVRAGSGTASELDYVAMYTQLRIEYGDFVQKFNTHVHPGVTVGMGSTGSPAGIPANDLSARVASANVVVKKR